MLVNALRRQQLRVESLLNTCMETAHQSTKSGQHQGKGQLGPLLCWAVVFADIGSSIYYVPGILYGRVGNLAGFFVLLTMSVFILLTLKYAEVSARFPEGGGVVTVAAQAMNPWIGALGGMFILVSYFLTAAISCLSAIQYLSVVIPEISPFILAITIGVLVLLGVLNWIGISESAKVSLVAAIVAFVSDLAIIWTVFTHIPISTFPSIFAGMFTHASLTPASLLVGFAGAFLAFSGLESISQLSPVMKTPRKKVIGLALLLVVLTIGLTSPLLTMLSTVLLPRAAADPVLSTQIISLLGGHWGSVALQAEIAISASLILVFASNTAIIGAYHVFMALSRMEFFPRFILKRNKFRGTPHWSILLATGIPIAVLLFVNGEITILGDMYAFGLLGAFSVTCLGLDVLRSRERRMRAHEAASQQTSQTNHNGHDGHDKNALITPALELAQPLTTNGASLPHDELALHLNGALVEKDKGAALSSGKKPSGGWHQVDYWLGIFTTLLVISAWLIGLVSKPLATTFGGSVALAGMIFAAVNFVRGRGYAPVVTPHLRERLPDTLLAVLIANDKRNEAVINTAIHNARGKTVVFLYLAEPREKRTPRLFEVMDPYLDDQSAKDTLRQAARLAREAKLTTRFVYQQQGPEALTNIWHMARPHDVVLPAEQTEQCKEISPDLIRYELTSEGKIAHLLKRW
jgi:amino acid transporter